MHYINLDFMDCSRLNRLRRFEIHNLYKDIINNFNMVYEFENYLFSHAGIYENWLNKYEITLEQLKDFKSFIENQWETLEDLSIYRGGWSKVGSCVWADIRESVENELYSDKRQIVGHTQLSENPYITSKIACLDVRQCFILDTEKDEIEPLTEETTEVFS